MGEKFTSRVGYLIRNFRIASDMTQKELADKCGLNESTIRNYELGNRYPDEATLLKPTTPCILPITKEKSK